MKKKYEEPLSRKIEMWLLLLILVAMLAVTWIIYVVLYYPMKWTGRDPESIWDFGEEEYYD